LRIGNKAMRLPSIACCEYGSFSRCPMVHRVWPIPPATPLSSSLSLLSRAIQPGTWDSVWETTAVDDTTPNS
jgi:hypothetical protein